MKIIKVGLALILALYLARFFGMLIMVNDLMNGLFVFLVVIIFIFSSIKHKFALFSFVAFIPFSFHPKLTGVELLAPVLCFLLLIELLVNKRKLLSKKAAIWFVAIGIISTWSFMNFARNPVMGMFFFGSGLESTGLRSYYNIFVGITVFFSSYWFIQYKYIDAKKLFLFLIAVSLLLSFLLTISYFSGVNIPLLNKFYKFMTISETRTYFRIQGLSRLVILAIPLLLSVSYRDKFTKLRILLILIFILLLLLSGARTMFAATMLSIFIFISFIRKTDLLPFILLITLVSASYMLIIPQIQLPGHLERMTGVSDAVDQQADFRFKAYEAYYNEFLENPIFGKGVGYTGTEYNFVAENLIHGGHGAYISVLAIYGIGGIVYFSLLVFGTLYHSYKLYKVYKNHHEYALWTLFAFLYIVIRSISFLSGGDGIKEYDIWYLAGIVAGIRSLDYKENINMDDRVNLTNRDQGINLSKELIQ